MNFQNDVVWITGGSNGIGKGVALAYAEQGAQVVLADIDEENGRQVVHSLNERGYQASFTYCDVRKVEDLHRLADTSPSPTILINNAGVSRFHSIFDITVDEWDAILETNLRSMFVLSKRIATKWRESKTKGRIINIASTRAFMSEPDSEAYAASKGGIVALTHALAASLSPYHIRVNSISPGWIQTENYDQLREVDHHQHLANRVGTPHDIAKACFYLSEESNDFVTGENIVVDGGMTRKMMYEN
ncbi:3-ketoacyl-ACP reductase [Pontibacillus halophilus JSM 076056 = DSM 19796]|uniref:3-ketoacyl-ACP reductase n=1 Tax=Pontibacillus halophilus JSM 076056 = DSM 19796 TaxID=1385510 RepID=A0A0A5GEG8_9BACI|nr:SDR family oxidoreductase [Pontibacillus halophilus]KGX91611.1 3-ketoacyl-ACP reductase [Pontibacillus halophilus JSM 076056 = DSM 19796]